MIELRWYVSEDDRVLQYRTQHEQSDYGSIDPKTKDFVRTKVWGPWRAVPDFYRYNADDNRN